MSKFSKGDRVVFNESWYRPRDASTVPAGTEATVIATGSTGDYEYVLLSEFPTAEFSWMNVSARVLDLVVEDGWKPTIENCDNYMEEVIDWYDALLNAMSEWLSNKLGKDVSVESFDEDIFAFDCSDLEKDLSIRYFLVNSKARKPQSKSYLYSGSLADLIEEMRL